MRIGVFLAASILFVTGALPAPASAQGTDSIPRRYALDEPSHFESGCQDPCACPVLIRAPVTGTFVLTLTGDNGLFRDYCVDAVDWTIADGNPPRRVSGAGTYRIGGEVAIQHQLVLDLSFDGEPSQHLDSGLQGTTNDFPKINISAAAHGFFCWDTVLVLHAAPESPVSGIGRDDPRFGLKRARPNPFARDTQVDFVLPSPATVRLRVLDLVGRLVQTLAVSARLDAGPHSVPWDGRDRAGRRAPPGEYLVQLETGAGRAVLRIVKLD